MYHSFLIHLSADGHLGCFRVLAIVNSASMNIGLHVSFQTKLLSGYKPRNGIAAHQDSLSITKSWSLLKLMSIELVTLSNHLILCRPLLPPSIFLSIRVFSNESVLHIRWPKNWSFSYNISVFNEYSGLISFRMDWLDLLAVQGTLKSLL